MTTKLLCTLNKTDYSLAEFTDLINFLLQNEALNTAYWISTNGTAIPMQRITIKTAYTEKLYNGFAIITEP